MMKLDRLLAMTMILINQRKVQAQDLADMFEVSVRTIYRDIETLSLAGIPIVTYQGQNGGIGLMEGYRMDKQLLTKDEINAISIALKSISTTYKDVHTTSVLEKIKGVTNDTFQVESVIIDLSPWGGNAFIKKKVSILKQSIEASKYIHFYYTNRLGETIGREVEPYKMVLKGQSWYLYGYCLQKNEFRLFKVVRMRDLICLDKSFERRDIANEQSPWDKEWYDSKNTTKLTLAFPSKYLTMMEEIFGAESIVKDSAGRLIVKTEMPDDDGMYGFLLSLTDRIEVLEPIHVRVRLNRLLKSILNKYE